MKFFFLAVQEKRKRFLLKNKLTNITQFAVLVPCIQVANYVW